VNTPPGVSPRVRAAYIWVVKRVVLLGPMLALAVAAPASARLQSTAPVGNSAINQYLESIPTVKGNRPTSSIQTSPGAPGGPTAGSGAGGSAGTTAASGPASAAGGGTNAVAAVALARATAPRTYSPRTSRLGPKVTTTGVGNGSSALSSLVRAFTGSTGGGGGLGPLLPAILVVAVLGATVLVLVRRRQTS
jgi:hypothetical protein